MELPNSYLERGLELEKFRMKLWDKFLSIQQTKRNKRDFDSIWYEFLIQHFISGLPFDTVYRDIVDTFEQDWELIEKGKHNNLLHSVCGTLKLEERT